MITNFKTDFNVVLNKPMYAKAAHGETLQFVANLFNDAVSVDLDGYTLSALYREFGNTSSYYVVPGSIETSGNVASFTWTKECDFGERAYKIYLVATKGDEVSYPARWELDLYDVPGYTSYPVVPVPPILDFDKYELLNAPWYTKEETDDKLSGKADLSAIPLSTSQLVNDSGFITSADIPPIPQGEFLPLSGGTMTGSLEIDASEDTSKGIVIDDHDGGRFEALIDVIGLHNNDDEGLFINYQGSFSIDTEDDSFVVDLPHKSGTIALTSDIPTKTSDLSNDSGFITSADIPQGDYLPLSGGTLSGVLTVSDGNNAEEREIEYILINAGRGFEWKNADTGDGETHFGELPNKDGVFAVTSDIPTKNSELENDSGFITASDTLLTKTDKKFTKWATNISTYYGQQLRILKDEYSDGFVPTTLDSIGYTKGTLTSLSLTWKYDWAESPDGLTATRQTSSDDWHLETDGSPIYGLELVYDTTSVPNGWCPARPNTMGMAKGDANSTEITWIGSEEWGGDEDLTATRGIIPAGYIMGPNKATNPNYGKILADANDIPTNTSELENDSGFATSAYVDQKIGNIGAVLDTINGEVL